MNITKNNQINVNQKITVHIPRQLLRDAQNVSHENMTNTIVEGLRLLIAVKAAENLRRMRGKVHFSINIKELRKDR